MKQLRSSRHLIKIWHRRGKATIGSAAAVAASPAKDNSPARSAYTPGGLAIEEQVRKAWRPWPAGLAMF